ncbi:MAG: type IV pilus secretin PilQ [Candidatus Omnitrophota bacterium]
MTQKAVIAIFILCLTCFAVYAQDSGEAVSSTDESSVSAVAEATDNESALAPSDGEQAVFPGTIEPTVSLETNPATPELSTLPDPGHVTLDFRDAEIRNVLRILAYKSGVNIVAGPEVTGLVTIQLNNVPWEEALKVILETYGYGYDKRGNIILVTTVDNLKKRREDNQLLSEQEPLMTKTFVLNYAKAEEIVSSIEKMKTARGSVNFDSRTNSIILRDTSSNLALISDIMPSLDATTPQVLIEAKIIEATLSNTENLGIDWVAKAAASGSERPTIFPFTTISENRYLPDNIPAAGADLFTYGTLDFSQFSAVLELLKNRSDTNILSNPRIVTLDNQKASITVGTQYPIPTYTYNEEQARLQVSGWEYKDIGIIFEVTPHVNNAGFVTMDIQPKVTAILDYVTVENTSLPRLSSESATTKVMIKDGYTLVIAGLIKNQATDVKKKIPFLGDIPIAGLAFQKSEKTMTKTDLLIFMTPHIITANEPVVLKEATTTPKP